MHWDISNSETEELEHPQQGTNVGLIGDLRGGSEKTGQRPAAHSLERHHTATTMTFIDNGRSVAHDFPLLPFRLFHGDGLPENFIL